MMDVMDMTSVYPKKYPLDTIPTAWYINCRSKHRIGRLEIKQKGASEMEKTMTQSAQCAKAIRTLLKSKYPSIKFSVTSDNFSMGNSVDVRWNLGPTTKEIDSIIRDYQYGHFNGMEDIYENDNRQDNIPQAKYVHAQRDFKTEEEIAMSKIGFRGVGYVDLWKEEKTLHHIVMRDLCAIMEIEYAGQYTPIPQEYYINVRGFAVPCLNDMVYQLLSPVPLMTGYHGVRRCRVFNVYNRDTGKEVYSGAERNIYESCLRMDKYIIEETQEEIKNLFEAY